VAALEKKHVATSVLSVSLCVLVEE